MEICQDITKNILMILKLKLKTHMILLKQVGKDLENKKYFNEWTYLRKINIYLYLLYLHFDISN